MNKISPYDKCLGAFLSTAIGDALGWPNEFNSKNKANKDKVFYEFVDWERRSGRPYHAYTEHIRKGEYSDDTQLTLAVARSIIVGDWETFFASKELPYWLVYERGGGRTLRKSAKAYAENKKPWEVKAKDYFKSGGNGAVMRILPHVIANDTNNINDIINDVIKDSIITHGHPRAILGSTCYAYALFLLLKQEEPFRYGELIDNVRIGKDYWGVFDTNTFTPKWLSLADKHSSSTYKELWDETVENMCIQLDYIKNALEKGIMVKDTEVLKDLGCFDAESGAGDIAIVASIYLASKYSVNPMMAIKAGACTKGIDTDTIASITGGLVGMLNGCSWIEEKWLQVQDRECFEKIVSILMSTDKKKSSIKLSSNKNSNENQVLNTPIGKLIYLDSDVVPCGKEEETEIIKVKTSLGQTLYLKNVKLKDDKISTEEKIVEEKIIKENSAEKTVNNTCEGQLSIDFYIKEKNYFRLDKQIIDSVKNNDKLGEITLKEAVGILELLQQGKSEREIAKELDVETQYIIEIDNIYTDKN